MKNLVKWQWLSNEELQEIQLEKTKEFLIHAKMNSRYYFDVFKINDFEPKEIQKLSDLSVLPILDKQYLRENISYIISKNFKKHNCVWTHTSGTTGKALHMPLSLDCFQREYAFRTLHFSWGNIDFGNKIAICAGHPVSYYRNLTPPFWCYDYSNNWMLLSSYHLTEKNLPYYIRELEKFNPVMLKGYPSSIYLLALANKHMGYRINPKAVYVASETLHSFQRKSIEESFGCKVFMWYGTGEMCGNIAECEKGNYHLKLEHTYIEFLDKHNNPVNNGEEGRLVCTGFGNYALPLIRYDIGDVAIFSNKKICECGRGGLIVDNIVGRTEDYIITPDGRFVGRLDHIFKDALNVRNAQILQRKSKEITIRIVKEPSYTKKDEDEILRAAKYRLGDRISIRFDYVAELPRTKSGKFRFIISDVEKKNLFDNMIS